MAPKSWFGKLILLSPSHHRPWKQTQRLWGCCKLRGTEGNRVGDTREGVRKEGNVTVPTAETSQSHCMGTRGNKDELKPPFPPTSGGSGQAKRWALAQVAGKAAAEAGHDCPTLHRAKSSQALLWAINSTN